MLIISLLKIPLYICLSIVIIYIINYIYTQVKGLYATNPENTLKITDTEMKQEYDKIIDSIRSNYDRKQSEMNTILNSLKTNENRNITEINSDYNDNINKNQIQNNYDLQISQKTQLKQFIVSELFGEKTEHNNGRKTISFDDNINISKFSPERYTRKNTSNKEKILPTENLQIRDDISVFTDYSTISN